MCLLMLACTEATNPKATRLKSTPNLFETLGLKYDKSHAHATWKVRKTNGTWKFDTADEAVYPATLVRRMVECVVQQLPQGLLESSWRTFRFEALQQTGAQHRMQPPLIPEYASIDWFACGASSSALQNFGNTLANGG